VKTRLNARVDCNYSASDYFSTHVPVDFLPFFFFFYFFIGTPKIILYFISTVSGRDGGIQTRDEAVYTWRLCPLSYGRHPAFLTSQQS
jgi:hypothetical protein